MDKSLQELLTSMTNVMQSQQEAIIKQQAEIEQLKTGAVKTEETKPASDEDLDKAMQNFRF